MPTIWYIFMGVVMGEALKDTLSLLGVVHTARVGHAGTIMGST